MRQVAMLTSNIMTKILYLTWWTL